MSHDVFISYAHENKKIADAVCAKLEERGVRCWIAPRDILPGSSYAESIVQAIDESRSMVLVFSSEANRSPHIKREAERAVHNGIPIVPFRIEDVEPSAELGYFFGSQHWLDAVTPPLEQHIFTLADAIKVLIGDAKPHLEEPQAGSLVEPPAGQAAPTPRLSSASTLLRNKTVAFSIVAIILVALVGGGLYASGLFMPSTTPSSPSPAIISLPATTAGVSAGNGTQVTAENAQVKVIAQYQGPYTGTLGAPAQGNKSIKFFVTLENKAYTGTIFGNPYSFNLYTSDKQLIKPDLASFGSAGLHTNATSKPGDKQSGILVFQMKEGVNPVELRYDDFQSGPLVLPVQM
ncbi:MAG: TIR domain-containing protein [Halobacteriota archaeon]